MKNAFSIKGQRTFKIVLRKCLECVTSFKMKIFLTLGGNRKLFFEAFTIMRLLANLRLSNLAYRKISIY